MGFAADFERAWKPMADGIKAALLKELKEKNAVSLEAARKALERERRNWEDPLRAQYSFRKGLENKAPEHAEAFTEVLGRFQFAEAVLPPLPGKIPYIAGGGALAAAGGVISSLLPADSFLPSLIGHIPVVILGILVFAGIGAGLARTMWQAKAEAARKGCAELYAAQLKSLHDELLEICRKADKGY